MVRTALLLVGKQLPQLATTLEKQGSVSQAACVMLFGAWQTLLRGKATASSRTSDQRTPPMLRSLCRDGRVERPHASAAKQLGRSSGEVSGDYRPSQQ